MSREALQSATGATAAPPQSQIIAGALIVGADRFERAELLRRVAGGLFNQDERAALFYVGPEHVAGRLRAALPPQRLGGAVAAMTDVAAKGGAIVHGFDARDEESRYGALCMIRAGFYVIQSRARNYPFILALDGFTRTIEERRKALFTEAMKTTITAPGVIPVMSFDSFEEIQGCFGTAGLDLLMRFESNYILRSDFDAGNLELFWSASQKPESARALPRGKVLVVRQGFDAESSRATYSQEKVDLASFEVTAR